MRLAKMFTRSEVNLQGTKFSKPHKINLIVDKLAVLEFQTVISQQFLKILEKLKLSPLSLYQGRRVKSFRI